MNNQGKSMPFKGGIDLCPENTQSIKFKMAELQDIIDFKMGDIGKFVPNTIKHYQKSVFREANILKNVNVITF